MAECRMYFVVPSLGEFEGVKGFDDMIITE